MSFDDVQHIKSSLIGKDNFLKDKEITITVVPFIDLYLILECFGSFKIG